MNGGKITEIHELDGRAEMGYPQTFEQACSKIVEMLSEDEKLQLTGIPRDKLAARLHLTIGAEIRNKLGLWRPEAEHLLCSIAAADPGYLGVMDEPDGTFYVNADGASAILIQSVWDQLKA